MCYIGDIFRFISGSYDVPRYTLHYKTDAPLSIRALLYFPEGKPGNSNLHFFFPVHGKLKFYTNFLDNRIMFT